MDADEYAPGDEEHVLDAAGLGTEQSAGQGDQAEAEMDGPDAMDTGQDVQAQPAQLQQTESDQRGIGGQQGMLGPVEDAADAAAGALPTCPCALCVMLGVSTDPLAVVYVPACLQLYHTAHMNSTSRMCKLVSPMCLASQMCICQHCRSLINRCFA